MNFLKNLIIFFGTILLYLHIYIHFKISGINEFSQINDLSKQKIMTTIYYKLPFVFDGTTIIKPFDLKQIKNQIHAKKDKKDQIDKKDKKDQIDKKDKKERIYKKTYEKMALLEPSVRFFTNDTIYELKKNKNIDVHRNLECRNFYMVHSGKVIIYCIHPKYKDNLIMEKNDKNNDKNIDFIENNPEILRVELYPNSILFVPNYWFVYVKALEKSVVEKVQYKTILNEINFLYDKYS